MADSVAMTSSADCSRGMGEWRYRLRWQHYPWPHKPTAHNVRGRRHQSKRVGRGSCPYRRTLRSKHPDNRLRLTGICQACRPDRRTLVGSRSCQGWSNPYPDCSRGNTVRPDTLRQEGTRLRRTDPRSGPRIDRRSTVGPKDSPRPPYRHRSKFQRSRASVHTARWRRDPRSEGHRMSPPNTLLGGYTMKASTQACSFRPGKPRQRDTARSGSWFPRSARPDRSYWVHIDCRAYRGRSNCRRSRSHRSGKQRAYHWALYRRRARIGRRSRGVA